MNPQDRAQSFADKLLTQSGIVLPPSAFEELAKEFDLDSKVRFLHGQFRAIEPILAQISLYERELFKRYAEIKDELDEAREEIKKIRSKQ